MRNSLTDIQEAERYLQGQLTAADAAVYEARMLTSRPLAENVRAQGKVYRLLRLFRRRLLRGEIKAVDEAVFNAPEHAAFRERIHDIFKR